MRSFSLVVVAMVAFVASNALGDEPVAMRVADLNVGESQEILFASGKKVKLELLDLKETSDPLRGAVRRAEVTVAVDGTKVTLVSANYHLPTTVAGVQIDCPVTKGYRQNSSTGVAGDNPWGLDKDARLRLWPAGEPLLTPGTFLYPARQRWFASGTQMANEPTHVDGGENPLVKKIYYHYGLDIGGAEELVEVVAATDGLVVSSGKSLLKGHEETPAKPRYDVVYLLDGRGWYYRYSHLHTIANSIKPGAKVKKGQLVGLLGKEGGSGGWSHLHFDITGRQPSGKWGIIEGYAFLWEAYRREYQPKLQALARPHQLVAVGEKVILDGSRSWSADGALRAFDWTFTDGGTASGAKVERVYQKPGVYSEVLRIKNAAGQIDYDFAVVNVLDKSQPDRLPPSIHAVYAPTFGIKPGDPVTFLVRTFRTTDGKETWDFGDASPKVEVQSDGNVVPLARDGYARTVHRFDRPGHYVVRVERTNGRGETAVGHVHVQVQSGDQSRADRTPRQVAEQLAAVYGRTLDRIEYIPALPLVAKLRLTELTGEQKYAEQVNTLVAPYLRGDKSPVPKSGSEQAGCLIFAELANRAQGKDRERWTLLCRGAADQIFGKDGESLPLMPYHNEMSDAVFMAGPILAATGKLTGDQKYFDAAAKHFASMRKLCLRNDGIYRHSPLCDAAWGRGNGFPAIGLALALSDWPEDHWAYKDLITQFQKHMAALKPHQDEKTGCWHQVIDHPESYDEYSCTCMIGFAMQRGIRRGWLARNDYQPCVERAWSAIKERTSDDGKLVNVCAGTGKQKTLKDYFDRPAINGHDDRGGAMGMLFATELMTDSNKK